MLLNMTQHAITSKCAACIDKMLRANRVLKKLTLSQTQLRSDASTDIFGALAENSSLESMSLSTNMLQVNAAGAYSYTASGDARVPALAANKSIRMIDLRGNAKLHHSLFLLFTVLAKRPELLDIF